MFLVNDSVIEFKRELVIDNGLEKVIPFLLSNIVNLESWYGSIVGRGVLTPLFYEDPPILLRLLFQFLSNSSTPPPSLSPPTLTPIPHSVVLFLWLNGWSCDIWCAILLNGIMDVPMSSLKTLMCVLCNKAPCLLRSDTCGFLLVLWLDIKHTETHIKLRGQ